MATRMIVVKTAAEAAERAGFFAGLGYHVVGCGPCDTLEVQDGGGDLLWEGDGSLPFAIFVTNDPLG